MNPFLRNAIFARGSPYFSVLPFNLNWLGRNNRLLAKWAQSLAPVLCVDVGCRGGVPDELYPLRRAIHLIGFDADEEECAKINASKHPYAARQIFPLFVSGGDEKVDFHLYESRVHSSSRQPHPRFASLFAGPSFRIERTVEMKSSSLDDFFESNSGALKPDFLKIDTQGTEFEILEGAARILENCSMVEVEVEFLEFYHGQKLFHEVAAFLLHKGFDLFHLNRVFSQRRGYVGRAKGQLTFGDALFVRREDRLSHFSEDQLLKFAALLLNYGYLDVASHLAADQRIGERRRKELRQLVSRISGRWSMQTWGKRANPWIDRFILLLLNLRRDNGLAFDSDRSWPVR